MCARMAKYVEALPMKPTEAGRLVVSQLILLVRRRTTPIEATTKAALLVTLDHLTSQYASLAAKTNLQIHS